jgi:hypothetical protein
MPKHAIDYSKTIIYKICCKDPIITDVYIGHTTNLINRKRQHKESCINEKSKLYNLYVYQFIRDNGGWGNWDIVMIEEYNLNNNNEALQKERYWLEELKASLNKYIPSRTQNEYIKCNKENKIQYDKIYRETNKDIIKERQRKYREENKDIIRIKKKEYYEKIKNIKKQ